MKNKILETLVKTKTNFNQMSKEIYNFEKKAGFEKTSSGQLVKWLGDEVENYKKEKSKVRKQNKLMDIICLSMQISRRENMNLDNAWKRWWWKSKKYLKENI
jgi:hypothetical protein